MASTVLAANEFNVEVRHFISGAFAGQKRNNSGNQQVLGGANSTSWSVFEIPSAMLMRGEENPLVLTSRRRIPFTLTTERLNETRDVLKMVAENQQNLVVDDDNGASWSDTDEDTDDAKITASSKSQGDTEAPSEIKGKCADASLPASGNLLDGGTTPSAAVADIQFHIMNSDAYRVPVLWLVGSYSTSSGDGGKEQKEKPINDLILQQILPEVNCCTLQLADTDVAGRGSSDESSRLTRANEDILSVKPNSAKPLVSAAFCELLGVGMFQLHPCDTQDILKEAAEEFAKATDLRPMTTKLGLFVNAMEKFFRFDDGEPLTPHLHQAKATH